MKRLTRYPMDLRQKHIGKFTGNQYKPTDKVLGYKKHYDGANWKLKCLRTNKERWVYWPFRHIWDEDVDKEYEELFV